MDQPKRLSELITMLVAAHAKYGDRYVVMLRGGKINMDEVHENGEESSVFGYMAASMVMINEAELATAENNSALPYVYIQNDVVDADLQDYNRHHTHIIGEGTVDELVKQGKLVDFREI
jgi:hypothetical protein